MALSARFVRTQLARFKSITAGLSLESGRKGQEKIGQIMNFIHRREVVVKKHSFGHFEGAWILPRDKRRQGVLLYLHGGGYACGDLDYAAGVGSTLASDYGCRVFCPAYRLAPEHPCPAAVEDGLTSYEYLLKKGYDPAKITLIGESAGGGLCYVLCMKLKERGLPLPGAIVAISPWTDLTASGESYGLNREKDPSMTVGLLDFYARCYTDDRTDPMVSPLFGDLHGMPPSLILVGGDEIMLSDATALHEKLLQAGCKSRLRVAPDRWHGYVLYSLEEDQEDRDLINRFLSKYIAQERKLRWMRLDNAAKIYPAARSNNWSSVFRLSATLTEEVDVDVMNSALDVTVRRFPSIGARLRRGLFWYYLEQIPAAPKVQPERSWPVTHMNKKEVSQCAFRVLVYGKRVAVEFFHSLTDGSGGMVFLKTLLAEYLTQKHGLRIPAEDGVLGRLEEPSEEELEDSFQRYAGQHSVSRAETTAWKLTGTPEQDGRRNLICLRLKTDQVRQAAHAHGVSITAFLAAVMTKAILELQSEEVPLRRLRRPVKVQIPVNLRRLFPSKTLRNFALYTCPEVDPRLGDFSFDEICKRIHHHMGMEVLPQQMAAKIATNVGSERSPIVKILPLFIKNIAMKAVFNAVGERKFCLAMSNLGAVKVPREMEGYIERFDFVLGAPSNTPVNCGVVSFGDTLNINFTRSIRETELEYRFFKVLQSQGLSAVAESNG